MAMTPLELALNYISYRERSEKEVIDYLKRCQFEPVDLIWPQIPGIIEQLKGWRYLDDARLAEAIQRSVLRAGYGRSRVIQRLRRRGIDPKHLEGKFQESDPEPLTLTAQEEGGEKIKHAVERRYPQWREDRKEKQKALAFLIRRGFSYREATDILK